MKKLNAIWIALLALVLLSGIALGATYLSVITVHTSITDGQQQAHLYADALATEEVMDLYPVLEPNQAWVETLYLKNDGAQSITVSIMAQGNTAFGYAMFAPGEDIQLEPGEVTPVEITVYALPTAVPGAYNFSIIIYQ